MNDQVEDNLLKGYLDLKKRIILLERKIKAYDKNTYRGKPEISKTQYIVRRKNHKRHFVLRGKINA